MGSVPCGTLALARTLLLTGASPCGELPAAPVLLELSSGFPLLIRSSGDPFLPLAGSRVLAGTEVLLSIPPASILKIVLLSRTQWTWRQEAPRSASHLP